MENFEFGAARQQITSEHSAAALFFVRSPAHPSNFHLILTFSGCAQIARITVDCAFVSGSRSVRPNGITSAAASRAERHFPPFLRRACCHLSLSERILLRRNKRAKIEAINSARERKMGHGKELLVIYTKYNFQ